MGSCAPMYGCTPMDDDAPTDNGAPIGLMVKVGDVCLAVELDGIPVDVDPVDEALPDGCVT